MRLVLVTVSVCLFGLSVEPLRAELVNVDPERGTRGTALTLTGSGFSPVGKKPKLKALVDGVKSNGLKLKILAFTDTTIEAQVTGGKPGLYDVVVEPKKGTPTALADAFEICLVENVVATPQGGAPGEIFSICGACMPAKPGSVKVGKKGAKRLAWTSTSTAPCDPQGRIDAKIPKLPDGTYDLSVKTSVGTTVVAGGLRIGGGDIPIQDEILQADIQGVPFESTPPRLTATYNSIAGIFTVFAQSDTLGDNRTLLFTIAFNPGVQAQGFFNTLPNLTMTHVPSSGATTYVLDADPTTFVTTGSVTVSGNTLGKISGEFTADLIEAAAPTPGPGVTVRNGVFAVRETQ
jgi:hypothetical protein